MRANRRIIIPLLALFAVATRAAAQAPDTEAVRRAADDYLALLMEVSPSAGEQIDGTPPDRFPDYSDAAITRVRGRENALLARLRAMDGSHLFGTPAWLVYGQVREALESSVAGRVCKSHLWAGIDQIGGWHSQAAQDAGSMRLASDDDRRRALARFRDMGRFADVEIAHLREGMRTGYTAPRDNVRRVVEQLDGMIVDSLAASPFRSPAERGGTPAFRAAWEEVMRGSINPALRRYRDFLRDEYLPRARTGAGLSELPDGAACYRAYVRGATSLDVDPAELAARGRRARADLEAEMAPLFTRLAGVGDLRTARRVLRADTTHAYASRDATLAAVRGALDSLRAALPRAFSRVPGLELAVQAAPEYLERSSAPAWYDPAPADGSRPGTFYANLLFTRRSSMDVPVSTSHEGWPGHHLQFAWTRERPVAHPVLRLLWAGAYGEGWAMYAERLTEEMRVFPDELSRAGLLGHLDDALVALEVDPGIHALGWTRAAAVDSMMAISGRPRAQAESYADRSAGTPAQVVTYMTGYLEIMRLREQAKRALGPRFDLRRFHDVVLDDGPVTLAMLREKVERWIATGG